MGFVVGFVVFVSACFCLFFGGLLLLCWVFVCLLLFWGEELFGRFEPVSFGSQKVSGEGTVGKGMRGVECGGRDLVRGLCG